VCPPLFQRNVGLGDLHAVLAQESDRYRLALTLTFGQVAMTWLRGLDFFFFFFAVLQF
jgi:hypothetical protein